MDELREYLAELRAGWRDPYYWADHQLEQAALLALLVGMIGLGFKYAELRMIERMNPTP